ncbi:hypothetical protein IAR55_006257 [Kwoniella newhampshirensis]|uniref:tRNA-splicing endonuclease subunit Sen54 N-terminal domain-containing protein n=1 Tax=Kwoniella newhampshirensis TaxID=1651941 RepID=A0AAW0YU92_9TREE
MPDQAGPSRLGPMSSGKPAMASTDPDNLHSEDDPRSNLPSTISGATAQTSQDEEGEDDEERMDFKLIQSFADKIQHLPTINDMNGATARVNITIPKRGEKDFEPLQETVNLQDMMLQKSREALFNALLGVRGGHSKSISHAVLTPFNPFPRVLIVHGHHFDSMGITVRYPTVKGSKGKGKTSVELLPEEALYLLERGSLQIWLGKDAEATEDEDEGFGEWCEEDHGVKGAIEMSAMEGFGAFIGREGLTWERYQGLWTISRRITMGLGSVGLNFRLGRAQTGLLSGWRGSSYPGHKQPLTSRLPSPSTTSIYDPLTVNPYLPFFHVWKPATAWSKRVWDKGSEEGLQKQRPDYFAAIVEARSTPIPTIDQLSQVFDMLPDEPKGPIKRVGPQYERQAKARPPRPSQIKVLDDEVFSIKSWFIRLGLITSMPSNQIPTINIGALRNGDRGFVVAVNDSGNAGWVRFGRAGFAEAAVI